MQFSPAKDNYLCHCMAKEKTDIRALSKQEIEAQCIAWGYPAFRAKQVMEWIWKKAIISFDQMVNVPKSLKEQLNEHFVINAIKEDIRQKSFDGTIKFRFKLFDGKKIESVLIPVPEENRYTVCVSSQVGCSLDCSFCATGKMGLIRNLGTGEIFDQVFRVNEICESTYGHPITNVVYMGMGEPLLNYARVIKSIRYITGDPGMGMAARRITISTSGIAKMIRKLADEGLKINLALSLHAADSLKRTDLMSINESNDLPELMDALKYFYDKTGNKLSFEYLALRGINDTAEDAIKLAGLCKKFPVLVNIIEYNRVQGINFKGSTTETINAFAKRLRNLGIMATFRQSRGKDIDAACGQLANK